MLGCTLEPNGIVATLVSKVILHTDVCMTLCVCDLPVNLHPQSGFTATHVILHLPGAGISR